MDHGVVDSIHNPDAFVAVPFEADVVPKLDADAWDVQHYTGEKRVPRKILQVAQSGQGCANPMMVMATRKKLVQVVWMEQQTQMLNQLKPICAAPRCENHALRFVGKPAAFWNRDPPLILDPYCVPVCRQDLCLKAAQQAANALWSKMAQAKQQQFAASSEPSPHLQNQEEPVQHKTCNTCQKPDPTRFCTRCNIAWYCNEECQKQDWIAGHRHVCVDARQAATRLDSKPAAVLK